MEVISEVAALYYNNASEEVQSMAKSIFSSMDSSGDGRISHSEFLEFIGKLNDALEQPINSQSINFSEIDKNGDGSLDFVEFLTVFYLLSNGAGCDGCQKYLQDVYFTCVACFKASSSFDLCIGCYRAKNFTHHCPNSRFIDNHAMLALLRSSESFTPPGTSAQPQQPQRAKPSMDQSKDSKFEDIFRKVQAFNTGAAFGTTVTTAAVAVGCDIM